MSSDEDTANGNTDPRGLDLADPDVLRGFVLRLDGELEQIKTMVSDQGGTLDKIAKVLGIEPTRTLPPPIREELKSLHDQDAELRKTDADVSTQIQAVKAEAAEALIKTTKNEEETRALKAFVKSAVVEYLAPIAKGVGIIAAAATTIATLLWAAFRR